MLRTGHADRIRPEPCGCGALRGLPAINNLPCLAALEELDQIALLIWQQTEVETRVVVVGHIQERRETAVVEEAALRSRPERSEERRVRKECRSRWSPYH